MVDQENDGWIPATAPPPLATGDVHVWLASLDTDAVVIDRLRRWLSQDESARASRFRRERDEARYVAGRGMLRQLLGAYLRVDPSSLRFEYGAHGKPRLTQPMHGRPGGLPVGFNVSHAGALAVFAFGVAREIGVDVERIDPAVATERIAERFFAPDEVVALRALPANLQTAGFFACWTRKEAVLKAHGGGLSVPLDRFQVAVDPRRPAELLRVDWDPRERQKWRLQDLPVGGAHAAALVVDADTTIRRFRLEIF